MNTLALSNGDQFNFDAIEKHTFDIRVIAHALARVARWAAQPKRIYSVAAHSIAACEMAPQELKLEALMHDAAEAYIGDIPTPVKNMFPEIRLLEFKILECMGKQLGFSTSFNSFVKQIDIALAHWEAKELGLVISEKTIIIDNSNFMMRPHMVATANCEERFLNLYYKLKEEK